MEKKEREAVAKMLLVVRHARNWGSPQLTAEQLRTEAVEAEIWLEDAVGVKEFQKLQALAFKKK